MFDVESARDLLSGVTFKEAVRFAVTTVLAVYIGYLLSPFLGILQGVLTLVAVFAAFETFAEAMMLLDERDGIRELTKTYSEPWQRFLTVKSLLVIKEVSSLDYYKARSHLDELIGFLRKTNNSNYLARVLTMPLPSIMRGERSSIVVLKRLLRHATLGNLDRKIRTLEGVRQIMVPGKENSVVNCIVDVTRSIVDYDSLKRRIAKNFSVDGNLDETFTFGVSEQEYLSIVQDVEDPENSELEIWKSLIPRKSETVSRLTVRKTALRNIGVFVGLVCLPSWLFLTLCISIWLRVASFGSTMSDVAFWIVFLVVLSVNAAVMLVVAAMSLRNYALLDKILDNSVVFSLNDLCLCAVEVIRSGIRVGRLPSITKFRDTDVTLSYLVYLCSCAFVSQLSKGSLAIVWFPTSHMIKTGRYSSSSSTYFHARTSISGIPSQVSLSESYTKEELGKLSSQIVNLSETTLQQVAQNKDREDKLVWLYFNALRIGQFSKLEVAEVGSLSPFIRIRSQ